MSRRLSKVGNGYLSEVLLAPDPYLLTPIYLCFEQIVFFEQVEQGLDGLFDT
jgi:hypothetical protein